MPPASTFTRQTVTLWQPHKLHPGALRSLTRHGSTAKTTCRVRFGWQHTLRLTQQRELPRYDSLMKQRDRSWRLASRQSTTALSSMRLSPNGALKPTTEQLNGRCDSTTQRSHLLTLYSRTPRKRVHALFMAHLDSIAFTWTHTATLTLQAGCV